MFVLFPGVNSYGLGRFEGVTELLYHVDDPKLVSDQCLFFV